MSYGQKKKTYEEVELPTDPNIPVWVITPKEEKVIFERWRRKAFAKCDDLIQAYIACSNSYSNPLEATKMCKGINEQSTGCVKLFQLQKFLDIEREILIREKLEKRKELKAKEAQKKD